MDSHWRFRCSRSADAEVGGGNKARGWIWRKWDNCVRGEANFTKNKLDFQNSKCVFFSTGGWVAGGAEVQVCPTICLPGLHPLTTGRGDQGGNLIKKDRKRDYKRGRFCKILGKLLAVSLDRWWTLVLGLPWVQRHSPLLLPFLIAEQRSDTHEF